MNSEQLGDLARIQFIAAMIHQFPNEKPKMFAEDFRRVNSPSLKALQRLMYSCQRNHDAVISFFRSCKLKIVWPKADGAQNTEIFWRDYQSKFMELNTPLTDQTDDGQIAFHEMNGNVVWFPFDILPELTNLGLIGRYVNELKVHESLTDEHVEEIIQQFASIEHLIIPTKADELGFRLIERFAPTLRFLDCSYTLTQREDFPQLELKRYYSTGPMFTILAGSGEHSIRRILEMPTEEVDLSGSQCGGLDPIQGDVQFHSKIQKLKTALYGHRGSSWIGRVLANYYAYLDRNARTLKKFEMILPQSSREGWEVLKQGQKLVDLQIYQETCRFANLFHEHLPSNASRSYQLRLSRIAYAFFEDERLPCVSWVLSATLEGGYFELGIRGDPKPFIQMTFEFKQLKDFGPFFKPHLETFCLHLTERFNIPHES
ncbi:hypothetical protein M3Y95_00795600 [Aphelenchoides besseyi]|nr:hypothetical protein M3Y95_00795600 [Aphelenchoides besseyi]